MWKETDLARVKMIARVLLDMPIAQTSFSPTIVYKAQISKEHILAFFNGRNELEVVVAPKYLEQIMESPEPEMGMQMS